MNLNETMRDTAKMLTRCLPDRMYLSIAYRAKLGRKLNLNAPKTFNEKIQWVKLNMHDPALNTLVDKYLVKDVVANFIGKDYIIPTIGAWTSFDDIDFSTLPDQFVLKCNHDSHSVVICQDKKKLDYVAAKKRLDGGLKRNYFWHGREWAYKDVKPLIIAEPYIADQNDELVDYKFFCFKDYVDCVMVCSDRKSGNPKFYFVDKEWNVLKYNKRAIEDPDGFVVDKPKNLDKMFELAKELSVFSKMPFVRIDLYNVDGKIYFGEFTFSPDNGMDPNILKETDEYFGKLMHLQ